MLYVNPSTLPQGLFLAYGHAGRLVSTIYMIPLKDLDTQKGFAGSIAEMGPGLRRCDEIFGRSIGPPSTNESYEWV